MAQQDAEARLLRQRIADATLVLLELERYFDEADLPRDDRRRLRALLADLRSALAE